ncbi:CPBP family glutamic-type intramembrane protease [Clostridium sp.]|uniref:CPBP family glutamic-type intramembrane protease n=1 Tax=Clostridium sp. TaxID=1506 RepID=UPI003D6D39B8
MMILVCIVLGVWLCYVTIKSNSVIPASILHGAINVIGIILKPIDKTVKVASISVPHKYLNKDIHAAIEGV